MLTVSGLRKSFGKNEVLKGYAQMILAKYINLINPNRAQEVLLSAKKLNKNKSPLIFLFKIKLSSN